MKFIIALLFVLPKVFYAQGQDKLWLMGYGCCSPNFTGTNMDFRNGSLSIYPVQRLYSFTTTNGYIGDSSGNPLFLCNGVYVANALGDTMLNGGGLNPSTYTTDYSDYGLFIPQANLVIPFPDDSSKYYLFHQTVDDQGGTYASLHLYYSVIDMALDSGKGGVVQKNTMLLNDSLVPGRITACKHANGRDWWVFVHKFRSELQYKYLVTPSGIQGPYIDNLITIRNVNVGQALFSEDGTKYAYFESSGGLDIWSFDRCSGLFYDQIHIDIIDSGGPGGVAFSHNGRFLYVSKIFYLYQFDLAATDINASKIRIGTYDGFENSNIRTDFYYQKLAPDQKIYMVASSSVYDIHVINSPDSLGINCDFQQHSIHLPGFIGSTVPNFPNYFLPALGNSICDSLATSVALISSPSSNFDVFPNPASRLVYVSNANNSKIEQLHIYNTMGQLMDCRMAPVKNNSYIEIDVSGLLSGVYYLVIEMAGERVMKKVVRE